jgi:transmembrane sensor
MSPIITKELIFSYFMGNASAIQRQTIGVWAKDKANEEQLYRWLEEFETLHPEYDADLEGAVRNYYEFLPELNKSACTDIQVSALRWGVAAGVILLLGLAVFLTNELWQFKTYRTQLGERNDFALQDGSFVSLGSNSLLRVPRWGFGRESRDVYLVGEAFFYVKHTPANKRFVVKTAKHFEVEVLGTEFNVVARETGSRVILRKGKVQLNLRRSDNTPEGDRRKLDLKPGDVFTMDSKENASLNTTTLHELKQAWKGHLYIFEKTSLSEIMNQLREDHGVKAEFADSELASHTMTGKFTAENIDELFELIQGILGIQIIRQGDRVTISQPH